jgi:hypothetical protein
MLLSCRYTWEVQEGDLLETSVKIILSCTTHAAAPQVHWDVQEGDLLITGSDGPFGNLHICNVDES